MRDLFVLPQPFRKKKLKKDGGDKEEENTIIFPHQEESNYSHLTVLSLCALYPELLQTFAKEVWCTFKVLLVFFFKLTPGKLCAMGQTESDQSQFNALIMARKNRTRVNVTLKFIKLTFHSLNRNGIDSSL